MQDEFWLTYAVTAFLENFWYLVVAIFGAIVGSFLGVVIYRLPIIELTDPAQLPKGYSLSSPPSYCPHCRHKLESWENVPILGFLWLRGRCSDCKKPIPWRDFSMEILTAAAWVAVFHKYNGSDPVAWVNVVLIALFASVLIAAVFIDLDHFIVPTALERVGVTIGLARDILVIGIGFVLMQVPMPNDWSVRWNGMQLFKDTLQTHTYYGWLPVGFVGAAAYAGLLWVVSFAGFLAYARVEWESIGSAATRFFTYADAPPRPEGFAVPAEEESEVEDNSPPIRLRFSPGFIVLLSAGLLAYVIGPWSILAAVLPLIAFVAITRTAQETPVDALRRFFRSDDLPYEYEAPSQTFGMPVSAPTKPTAEPEPLITGKNVGELLWNKKSEPGAGTTTAVSDPSAPEVSRQSTETTMVTAGVPDFLLAPSSTPEPVATPMTPVPKVDPVAKPTAPPSFAETQAEADQFAKEAETGAHGGMGLGDVKLAIAIGAILGPGQAILSLIFAAFFGAVTGLILKAVHGKSGLRLAVPFVPFMAAGAFVCLLFGDQIITWYMGYYTGTAQSVPAQNGAAGPRVLPNGQIQLPSDASLRK